MSTQETESPDCQERVGLKRKLTGPPRLLLGKSKSKDKSDSQRRPRRDKCCEDTPEDINKPHHDKEGKDYSLQKASEQEEIETQTDAQGDMGIIVTLEENRGKEENMENKAGMTRSTNKTTIKRMFSSLLCSGRKLKESDTRCAEDRTENRNSQETKRNKAHTDTCNSSCKNKQCDANNKNGKGKRNFFFMVWPISKRSSVASNVNQGRQCSEETPPKASFKKIYRIFPRRKKAHPPIDHIECAEAEGDQVNQLSSINIEIPSTHKQEHRKEEREIEQSAPETFTISAEVSINTNIQSGHIYDKQEICTDEDAGKFVLSTIKEEKHPVMESTNDEILQTRGLLDTCPCDGSFYSELPGTSIALGDVPALNDANQEKSDKKCKPVITIDRVYTPEEVNVNEEPRLDFLSMNGSWQHLKINRLTDNTLHPTDPSVSSELDHSRCNETLLIQTAISMVQAAIRGAVEQLTNEQQQNQINLDSV